MRTPNFFAKTGLDRMAERRTDADWLRQLSESDEAMIYPVWRTQNLVVPDAEAPRAAHLSAAGLRGVLNDATYMIFLGFRGDAPNFAVDISHLDEPHALPWIRDVGEFTDLRDISLDMPREEGGLLAYVRAIAHWHQTHKFCGRCGSASTPRDGGHVRQCISPDCGAQHFPRTDAAVIMLVSSGDKIILARKKGWPEDRYSILAGFVEPGETIEGAVVREVMEEVGIPVTNVRYHSSQPWPFPANLMFGFFAQAESETIRIDDDELEHARWFHRDELIEEARAYADRPHSISIARRLIAEWALGHEP